MFYINTLVLLVSAHPAPSPLRKVITDPSKFIDVSVADEAADTDIDEDTDLDSDRDSETEADSDSDSETEVDPEAEAETQAHLDSTTTWDPSIPESDPKKKPS